MDEDFSKNHDSLSEYENSMTIYFYKRTGVISEFQTGINDMKTFGEHEQEYELIMDFIVIGKDEFFLTHSKDFKIDIEIKELIYLAPYQKYKIGGM